MQQTKWIIFAVFFSQLLVLQSVSAITRKQKEDLVKELTGKDFLAAAEIHNYSEIVGLYQSNQLQSLNRATDKFIHRFPQSPFADNALYLSGKLALEKNNYTTAIKYFSQIEKHYLAGNKNVSAQFAKAVAYKKMNLPELAKNVFRNLKKQYPGSSEALLAESELRLIK